MIEISASATTAVVRIAGDLDLAERVQFPEVTARVSGLRRQLLVLDMCQVTFLDSTGAAFLMALAEAAAKRGGTAVLRGVSDRDLFVLEICGALTLFRLDTEHRCPPPGDGDSSASAGAFGRADRQS
ncbi:STAS domain-containing protein [Georgenia yuyongxinii]|uniref:STAS domain-containing protein n=1 Tax=Georgenia yuyongxinii TaxID=2589797 RepID=A0A5B8C5X2_9MICO|nr:STAS domain-containing protein [Georgenia yuyongxinii]QDC26119.1 STAS domain-containing protein [Georgenia yuyongxinii]